MSGGVVVQIATKCQIKDSRLFLLAVRNRKREIMGMAVENLSLN